MHCLNKITLSLCCSLGLAATCFADPLSKLKSHHYLEAIQEWEPQASSAAQNAEKLKALKGQAIAYKSLGDLYLTMQKLSLELIEEYYNAIAENHSSPTLMMYRGQLEFYKGNYHMAIKLMEKVIRTKGVPGEIVDYAKVYRHYSLNKIHNKKGQFILNSKYVDVKWQMYELDEDQSIPAGMMTPSIRSHRNRLRMLMRSNNVSEKEIMVSLKPILDSEDQAEVSLEKGKLTQINFYDPILIQTVGETFHYISRLKYLEIKKFENKYPNLAEKFNTDYSMAYSSYKVGKYKEAERLISSESSTEAQILHARVQAGLGNKAEARKILASLEKKVKEPDEMRDLGIAYLELGISQKNALEFTKTALAKKKSSSYYKDYARVLISIGKNQDALDNYSKGYKIQYRNNIEQNDPEYMIEYATAIFKLSKMRFEEVVETMYHIQKVFPVTRLMHYCMQGIAAANTNTFNSEKIFRKGG